MNAPKPALRDLALNHTAKIVEQHAKEQGIMTLVPTGEVPPQVAAPVAAVAETSTTTSAPRKKGKGTANIAQGQSPVRRFAVDLPFYLISALRKRAAEDDTTIRYIVTRALRKDGFLVETQDLIEDGRRES